MRHYQGSIGNLPVTKLAVGFAATVAMSGSFAVENAEVAQADAQSAYPDTVSQCPAVNPESIQRIQSLLAKPQAEVFARHVVAPSGEKRLILRLRMMLIAI